MEHLIGGAAAVLGTVCWLPQTLKTWRSRETKDLSMPANLLILATLSLWLIYGVMIAAWPLILGNVISILLVSAIVIAKLRFG
ncbi:SemiSWEET family sugar transporter [Ruegeria faecimaris]|uniref:MtN3 and saliva related transmembrane protein n=1 Tax=Ruegeria faecimaris TaxID=686389 RepID=A0A521FBY5_9RHOB|nr:PQ-loop domain-containing transporter [Ruegeria faecimaris]SMO93010.1 MtN3 and saliva related transmembrane protein [Ruegeria faecimaris]